MSDAFDSYDPSPIAQKLAASSDSAWKAAATACVPAVSSAAAALRLSRESSRLEKLAAMVGVATSAWTAKIAINEVLSARRDDLWRVIVTGDDALYDPMKAWLNQDTDQTPQKQITVSTLMRFNAISVSEDNVISPRRMRGVVVQDLDEKYTKTVDIGGHDITVRFEAGDTVIPMTGQQQGQQPALAVGFGDDSSPWAKAARKIIFTAQTEEGQRAVIQFLETTATALFSEEHEEMGLWLHTVSKYNGWNPSKRLTERSLESVVLPPGKIDAIIEDITEFLKQKDRYDALGIPWHRGYLLSGPPGGGKTSLARAIATHFEFDVYQMSLADVKGDAELMDFVSSIPSRSVLIMEDVDAAHATRNRLKETTVDGPVVEADSPRPVTASGLYNVLDGNMTPDGLIVIMTTNYPEVLDEALLRPGRIDVHVEIDYIEPREVVRLFEQVYGETPSIDFTSWGNWADGCAPISAADIVGCIKPYMDDATAATAAINELIAARTK